MGCWKLAKQARVAGAWRAGGRVWKKWSERAAEGQAMTALLGHRRTLTFTPRETGSLEGVEGRRAHSAVC